MSAIGKIPLFAEVSEQQLRFLEEKSSVRTYLQDELILDFEDKTTDVLFILKGKVRVLYRSVTGREVILADLGQGNFFGELSAIDRQGRSANVTALQLTEICTVPAELFMELAVSVPSIARHLLEVLVQRIRVLDMRFSEMSVLKTNERLYAELLRLSSKRRGHEGQRIISPPPFHHHLAGRIGCRREVVSRELSALMKQGIIEKTRGGLVILKVEDLNSRVEVALSHPGRVGE